jgi:hypothetical protein
MRGFTQEISITLAGRGVKSSWGFRISRGRDEDLFGEKKQRGTIQFWLAGDAAEGDW